MQDKHPLIEEKKSELEFLKEVELSFSFHRRGTTELELKTRLPQQPC